MTTDLKIWRKNFKKSGHRIGGSGLGKSWKIQKNWGKSWKYEDSIHIMEELYFSVNSQKVSK